MRFLRRDPCILVAFVSLLALAAPTSAADSVSFRSDIAPLLHRRCATCHGEENAKGNYRLDTFARLTRAGESELPPIIAGDPEESELYQLLIEPAATDRMPQKADPLPAAEIALIRRWIQEGARFDGAAPEQPLVELARETLLRPAPAEYPSPAPVTAIAFSPDGSMLATSGYYEVLIWRLEDLALLQRIGGVPERITSLAWHPTRPVLGLAGGSPGQWGAVLLIDLASEAVHYLCDLPDAALSVAFRPAGDILAAGCSDRTIRFFDVAAKKQIRVLRQHADWVQSVAFNNVGTLLVSASRDRTARTFEVGNGDLRATYDGHEAPVLAAFFAPDDANVLSVARGEPLVHVWDANSGQKRKEKFASDRDVQSAGANALGVLTGRGNGLVRLFDYETRKSLFTLFGHSDSVSALAVRRDSTEFATGSINGEVCIWDAGCETWRQRFAAQP